MGHKFIKQVADSRSDSGSETATANRLRTLSLTLICGQNPRTDADAIFRDPHNSDSHVKIQGRRIDIRRASQFHLKSTPVKL